jgi:hypothetical protein
VQTIFGVSRVFDNRQRKRFSGFVPLLGDLGFHSDLEMFFRLFVVGERRCRRKQRDEQK